MYSICAVMDEIDPQDELSFEESSSLLKEWLERNNASYYSAPRENFFIYEAIDKAKAEGKSAVVVEDLS